MMSELERLLQYSALLHYIICMFYAYIKVLFMNAFISVFAMPFAHIQY